MKHIIEVLGASVEKHGEKPLTNKWLLNLLKVTREKKLKEQEKEDLGLYTLGRSYVFD